MQAQVLTHDLFSAGEAIVKTMIFSRVFWGKCQLHATAGHCNVMRFTCDRISFTLLGNRRVTQRQRPFPTHKHLLSGAYYRASCLPAARVQSRHVRANPLPFALANEWRAVNFIKKKKNLVKKKQLHTMNFRMFISTWTNSSWYHSEANGIRK